MAKVALITGITGQDGAYLAELLLDKGYIVHGVKRRSSLFNTQRIDHLYHDQHEKGRPFFLHHGDLTDSTNLIRIVQEVQPDEIYNLAAMSHVKVSFETPEYTANADGIGALRLLEAIRILNIEKKTKFYQASTSELYGLVQEVPQKETTPFYPRSPYGVAKLYAFWIVKNYREAYGMYACNGILFNHAERDWGHAKDYVEGMWRMLQQDVADDFVLATGKKIKVRTFVEWSFREVGITLEWKGKGIDEKGIDKATGEILVQVDKEYFRPSEVDLLLGDASKAKRILGWEATTSVEELCKEMVASDLKIFSRDKYLMEGGHSVSKFRE